MSIDYDLELKKASDELHADIKKAQEKFQVKAKQIVRIKQQAIQDGLQKDLNKERERLGYKP